MICKYLVRFTNPRIYFFQKYIQLYFCFHRKEIINKYTGLFCSSSHSYTASQESNPRKEAKKRLSELWIIIMSSRGSRSSGLFLYFNLLYLISRPSLWNWNSLLSRPSIIRDLEYLIYIAWFLSVLWIDYYYCWLVVFFL